MVPSPVAKQLVLRNFPNGSVRRHFVILFYLSETCRCPSILQANWIPSAPYVIRNTSTSNPNGILPEILSRMLLDSCGTCLSYKTWNISYAINTTLSVTTPDKDFLVDFRFPVRSAVGRTIYQGAYSYVPLITVPGVALLSRKKTPSAYARDVERSVYSCWPVLAMSFVLAILTGIVLWFAVSDFKLARSSIHWISLPERKGIKFYWLHAMAASLSQTLFCFHFS